MNILSYLIKHKDSNVGNFLISTDPKNPRVFAVDNSLAFSSLESNRGTAWQKVRVKRLPKKTIERLKLITKIDLEHALSVVAQFEVHNGQLVSVDFTENLNEKKGIRRSDRIIQFGITKREIGNVFKRMQNLIKKVESGKIKTF